MDNAIRATDPYAAELLDMLAAATDKEAYLRLVMAAALAIARGCAPSPPEPPFAALAEAGTAP